MKLDNNKNISNNFNELLHNFFAIIWFQGG